MRYIYPSARPMAGKRKKGDFIGEEAFILGALESSDGLRTADVVAVSDSKLGVFSYDHLQQMQVCDK